MPPQGSMFSVTVYRCLAILSPFVGTGYSVVIRALRRGDPQGHETLPCKVLDTASALAMLFLWDSPIATSTPLPSTTAPATTFNSFVKRWSGPDRLPLCRAGAAWPW